MPNHRGQASVRTARGTDTIDTLVVMTRHLPAALVIALLVLPLTAYADLYRWVDEDGNVHYSDRLPPEHASDSRREFRRDGTLQREVERAPTAEELEALEQARLQARLEREREHEETRKQREYDRMLLLTYSSIEDLEQARESRLEHVRSQIDIIGERKQRLIAHINQLEQEAARAERSDSEDLDAIYKRLERSRQRLEEKRVSRAEQESELEAIREEFAAHITRFEALRRSP